MGYSVFSLAANSMKSRMQRSIRARIGTIQAASTSPLSPYRSTIEQASSWRNHAKDRTTNTSEVRVAMCADPSPCPVEAFLTSNIHHLGCLLDQRLTWAPTPFLDPALWHPNSFSSVLFMHFQESSLVSASASPRARVRIALQPCEFNRSVFVRPTR